MRKNYKKTIGIVLMVGILASLLCVTAFATGGAGNVAGVVEQTWQDAARQIKTVVDKVVFPALSMVLVIAFLPRPVCATLTISSAVSLNGPALPSCLSA